MIYLCSICKPKTKTPFLNKGKKFTLKKALNKTYQVRGYISKNGSIKASISVPSILAGRKVKVKLPPPNSLS